MASPVAAASAVLWGTSDGHKLWCYGHSEQLRVFDSVCNIPRKVALLHRDTAQHKDGDTVSGIEHHGSALFACCCTRALLLLLWQRRHRRHRLLLSQQLVRCTLFLPLLYRFRRRMVLLLRHRWALHGRAWCGSLIAADIGTVATAPLLPLLLRFAHKLRRRCRACIYPAPAGSCTSGCLLKSPVLVMLD